MLHAPSCIVHMLSVALARLGGLLALGLISRGDAVALLCCYLRPLPRRRLDCLPQLGVRPAIIVGSSDADDLHDAAAIGRCRTVPQRDQPSIIRHGSDDGLPPVRWV